MVQNRPLSAHCQHIVSKVRAGAIFGVCQLAAQGDPDAESLARVAPWSIPLTGEAGRKAGK